MKRPDHFVRILDTTCRDGMHAVRHQFTAEQVAALAAGAESAGVDIFEVSHGDGLGGSSINYGYGAATDEQWLKAAAGQLKNTKLAFLMLPGIGTMQDIDMAAACGASVARITVHCTEANITEQHIRRAQEHNMEIIGVLMMTHMIEPEALLTQAKIFEDYGADIVYCMDSAGHLLPDGVRARVGLLAEKLNIPVGFHAHNNLGLAMCNTMAALDVGASMVDGTLKGLGAGAGNAMTEVIAAVLNRAGYQTNIDLYKIMDVAENVLAPMLPNYPTISKAALTIGYAGVYGSFALHAERAAKRYNLDARDILVELGRRKIVGGQEDMIIQVAVELANKRAGQSVSDTH